MKTQINFFQEGQAISRQNFEQFVPADWREQMKGENETEYSYGIYRASLCPPDFDDVVDNFIDHEISDLLLWAQENAPRAEREAFAVFAAWRPDFHDWSGITVSTEPVDHFPSADGLDWDFFTAE